MNQTAMRIVYNGEPLEISGGATVADVLAQQQVRPEIVAVEVNLELVPRQQHAEKVLCNGDQVEVVTLVGGG